MEKFLWAILMEELAEISWIRSTEGGDVEAEEVLKDAVRLFLGEVEVKHLGKDTPVLKTGAEERGEDQGQ